MCNLLDYSGYDSTTTSSSSGSRSSSNSSSVIGNITTLKEQLASTTNSSSSSSSFSSPNDEGIEIGVSNVDESADINNAYAEDGVVNSI